MPKYVAFYFTLNAYELFFFRPGKGKFGPEQVDGSLCTHIIYSWAHLSNTSQIVPGVPELDVDNGKTIIIFLILDLH